MTRPSRPVRPDRPGDSVAELLPFGSLRQIAQASRLHYSNVTYIARGLRDPHLSTLLKLAAGAGVGVGALVRAIGLQRERHRERVRLQVNRPPLERVEGPGPSKPVRPPVRPPARPERPQPEEHEGEAERVARIRALIEQEARAAADRDGNE